MVTLPMTLRDTSDLVYRLNKASPSLPMKNHPERGVVLVMTHLKILHSRNISGMAKARDFKLCTRVGHVKI